MARDVRMRGFRNRTELPDVLRLLQHRVKPLEVETIDLSAHAAGRVLTADIYAAVSIPPFARAAMDGYALRGAETFGASAYNPLELDILGEALPGVLFPGTVTAGQAVRIMTGAPLPSGADCVLPAELAEEVAGTTPRVRVQEPVPPGRHVGQVGEDIPTGTRVLAAGRYLRPQDLGVLASIGATRLDVVRRPRVAILITGNELLPCGARPEGYRIVDSNSIMLTALLARDGAAVLPVVMVRDEQALVRAALQEVLAAGADVVFLSGGSSVGQEDHAPRVLAELGEVSVHGIALRPASPTGIGFVAERPVFLLPGNPVSCLCAYDLCAGPTVRRLGGRSVSIDLPGQAGPYRLQVAPLAHKLASAVGRFDYVRVRLSETGVEPLATSGASILSSTTRADGFVLVPTESEGYPPGHLVTVFLYD